MIDTALPTTKSSVTKLKSLTFNISFESPTNQQIDIRGKDLSAGSFRFSSDLS